MQKLFVTVSFNSFGHGFEDLALAGVQGIFSVAWTFFWMRFGLAISDELPLACHGSLRRIMNAVAWLVTTQKAICAQCHYPSSSSATRR